MVKQIYVRLMEEWTFLNIVIEVLLDKKTRVNKYSRFINTVGSISTENGIPIIVLYKTY